MCFGVIMTSPKEVGPQAIAPVKGVETYVPGWPKRKLGPNPVALEAYLGHIYGHLCPNHLSLASQCVRVIFIVNKLYIQAERPPSPYNRGSIPGEFPDEAQDDVSRVTTTDEDSSRDQNTLS